MCIDEPVGGEEEFRGRNRPVRNDNNIIIVVLLL